MFELSICKHTQQKECLTPALETSKTADMGKNDTPITQIGDEVKIVGEDPSPYPNLHMVPLGWGQG
jgi:hypothetical protein